MIDLDRLMREADPARDLEFPPSDPDQVLQALNGFRRPRPRAMRDALVVAMAIAVVVGVGALALSLGGQREHPPGSGVAPSGSLHAAPLLRILGVLRQPATAADRAAAVKVRAQVSFRPQLVRLAATTPWRVQVILFTRRARHADRLEMLATSHGVARGRGGRLEPATLVVTGGGAGWTAQQIEAGRGVLQERGALRGRGPFSPRGTRLFMVVPDGVTRVGFLKGPDVGAGSWVSVSVENNLAFVQLPEYCCGPTVVARWYNAGGRVIKVTGSPAAPRTLRVLRADGIGDVSFGSAPRAVRAAIDVMLRQAGGPLTRGGSCGLDHQIKWWDQWTASGEPALTVYFRRGAFVGYQYGDFPGPGQLREPSGGWRLATTRGLRIGDALARGRRLYGSAFLVSAAQGGSWSVRVAGGALRGYATPASQPGSRSGSVETIDGGDVGCPALSP